MITADQNQQWVGNPTGQTDSQIGADISNGYAATGADPSGLVNDGISGSGVWGNGPGEWQQWANQANASLQRFPQQQQAQQQQQQLMQSLQQPNYLGQAAGYNASTVTAPTAQAAQLSPQLLQSLGSGATIQQLLTAIAPQAQSAQNNLNQTLADFGVGGGQAVGAQSQLQSQLMASLAPSIASAIQNSQSNQLNAGEFNAGNQQSTNTLNANNALESFLANQAATNQAGQFNASNLNNTNAYNVGAANQANQQTVQDMLNQYYAQMGAFNNINNSGQGAGNQSAINYGNTITQTPSPFQDILGAASAAAPFSGSFAVTNPGGGGAQWANSNASDPEMAMAGF